jgi:hypothetical protein
MARFLGRSAEKRFSTLCSDLGITCNEPREDDHGWDHIVEIPHLPIAGLSADLQQPIPALFVQTKSHEADGLHVSMKLSNALKLARTPSPCFVVLMNMAADSTTPTWHAVHFWEVLIGRVLKRAREASRDGIPEERFHELSFSFTMGPADVHSDQDLLPWMEQSVRAVRRDYGAAKKALHADSQIVGIVKIGPLSSIEELVDHQLGLTKSIPMASVTLDMRRFGVDLPLPIPDWPIAFASMQSLPSDRCDVRLRGPDGFRIALEGDIIIPSVPNLEDEHKKVRIRTPIFDIIWSFAGAAQIKAHLDTTTRQSPAEIERVVRFASWGGQGEIDLRVSVRDEPILGAAASMDALPGQESYAAMAEPVAALARLSGHLKTKIPQISIIEILASKWVFPLYSFLNGTEMNVHAPVTYGAATPGLARGVAAAVAPIGGWVFAALQRFPIIGQREGDGLWHVAFGAPVLLEPYVFEAGDEAAIARMQSDYMRHATKPGVFALDNIIEILNRDVSGDDETGDDKG